jgi:hypothetical protein
VLGQLAPLKQATQLQNLHLWGANLDRIDNDAVAKLLPVSLQQLCWDGPCNVKPPDFTHLKNLTSVRLQGWFPPEDIDSRLPPGLSELELAKAWMGGSEPLALEELQGQQQTLTGYTLQGSKSDRQLLPQMTALKSLHVYIGSREPGIRKVTTKLPNLSTLRIDNDTEGLRVSDLEPMMSRVAGIKGLRCLQLRVTGMQPAPGLCLLTGLSRLVIKSIGSGGKEHLGTWANELGQMANLKWLSVPSDVLLTQQAWLGGLKQLQVLVLSCGVLHGGLQPQQWFQRVVQWLKGCNPQDMPPQLLLLGCSVTPWQAYEWGLRGRVLPLVGSSGYEVVVGPDLDEVSDAMQQLAGWPTALQRALV